MQMTNITSLQMQVGDSAEWVDISSSAIFLPELEYDPKPDITPSFFIGGNEITVTFQIDPKKAWNFIKAIRQPRRKAAYQRRYRNGAKR